MDFLDKYPRDVDEDTEIVTFDVISMYSKYREDLHPRFRKAFVLESVNFILKNNTLTFDSKFYLQIKGTAMGKIFAPTYANLTMGYHEIKVYSIIRQSYVLASKYFKNSWFRYLDDCQILLKLILIKPNYLLSILNQVNNNIQFTMEKSQTRLPFLDIMISKSGKKSPDGYLQLTSRLKTICYIYVKPPTALLNKNKYIVLSLKKNMYHC